MATRKRFTQRPGETVSDAHTHAAFIKALLDGTIRAERLIETRDARGMPVLDYDDPNG